MSTIKVATQMGILPGESVLDKAKWARDHGFDGLELGVWGGGLEKCRRDADEINGVLPISSVCGNANTDNEPSFEFLDPDKTKRDKCVQGCKNLLTFCGEVGAAGQIVPPIFGGPKVPDLSPFMSPLEIEDALMIGQLKELGAHAAQNNTVFMLEPLNRYEQHYLKKLGDGVRVIEAAGSPAGVGILADLFHMHIEETNSPQALRDAAKYVTHLHLADNTRHEPGSGDIDFTAAFKALKEIGFSGYLAYECSVFGSNPKEKAENLAKSVVFVKDCLGKA
jgi:sugar phosphate isomerase/epimerase